MKLPIFAAFFLLFVMASGAAFAQSRDRPADSKVYATNDFPHDSQPHWMLADGLKAYGVSYLSIDGKGLGRSAAEADKKDAAPFDENTPHGSDYTVVGVIAAVFVSPDNLLNRQFLLYLQSSPDEGETQIGSVILKPNTARKFLNQLDDMLRVGRKWRGEGVAKENKKVALSTLIGEPSAGQSLNLAIGKTELSSDQTWSLWSNRVYFSNSNLTDLSKFRDAVEKAVKWLERQR